MVDIIWNNELTESAIPKHLHTAQESTNRRESLLSPRRAKQSRGVNCEYSDKKHKKHFMQIKFTKNTMSLIRSHI